MKSLRILTILLAIGWFCASPNVIFADDSQYPKVTISEVKNEGESTPPSEKWTGDERPENVSAYGAVKPVQLPVEYAGKAMDGAVSGVGNVATKIISYPFRIFHRNDKSSSGGQHAEETEKKQS